jgi:ABC-type multidrug transport system fused ATPase/permease subunit
MILKLLSKKELNLFFVVILFMILAAFLEAFSISLVLPIIQLINNFDNNTLTYFNKYSFFNNLEANQKIMFTLVIFLLIFFIKAFYLLFLSWLIFYFAFRCEEKLCSNLFKNYLDYSYINFLKTNLSSKTQNIIKEANVVIFNYLIPLLRILSEVFVFLLIIFFLFYMQPFATIIVFLISIIFISFYYFYFAKKLVFIWGKQRLFYDLNRTKIIVEVFNNFKLVKLLNSKEYFCKLFDNENREISKFNRYQQLTTSLPTIFLEFIAILCLVSVGLIVTKKVDDSLKEIIPITGLFAASAFRLIPSINRILSAIQSVKFSAAALKSIFEQLKNYNAKEKKIKNGYIGFEKLKFKNVSFHYNQNEKILSNINFEITKGDIISVIGKSGSGKSTLGDLILGFIKPTSGNILYNNKTKILNLNIGYVPQKTYLIEDTIVKNIAFGLDEKKININKVKKIINQCQLSDFIKRLKKGIYTNVKESGQNFSVGEIQRLGIARALYFDPDIILFDEPTSSLDLDTEKKILDTILALKGFRTYIIITHRKYVLKKSNKIFEISNKIIKIQH